MSFKPPAQCPRCQERMQPGHIIDFMGDGGRNVPRWMPGPATKSFWLGLKIDDADLVPVATFRCEGCGFLEHYARPEFAPK